MVQIIGLMIGFYIVTRMLSLGTRTGERAEKPVVRIMAIFTILAALAGMAGLVTAGDQITRSLGKFLH